MKKKPELSVIVPVLNESATLPELFASLERQEGVSFEVVVSDGGSADATVERADTLAATASFPVTVIAAPRGRGRQLNAGAGASRGEVLLFLHADSSFADGHALRRGLDTLAAALAASAAEKVAGHFALTFVRRDPVRSFGYYYYECKARLGRRECIHGDQGMLLNHSFFGELGGFDETVPVAEDTLFAEAVRQRGEWILLPAAILTSARRFETEGLRERQTLNAIIMNFAAQRRHDFFLNLPQAYPNHDRSRRLDLLAALTAASRMISALPLRQRLCLWSKTGAYVRDNAWQVAFAADCRRNFRCRRDPGSGSTPWLACYDRHVDAMTDNPPGRLAATCLTWLWFRLSLLTLFLTRKRRSSEIFPRK